MVPDQNFEARLIDALQPVRGAFLAQAIHQFFELGIESRLRRSPADSSDLATELDLDRARLEDFLRYLANEGVVVERTGGWHLAPSAIDLHVYRPWYTLLVGGYSETLLHLGAYLRPESGYAPRNGANVGIGSCGISLYDAIPLASTLLRRIADEKLVLIDIGCGDGGVLEGLLDVNPGLIGVGLEPDAGGFAAAAERLRASSVAERMQVCQKGLFDLADVPIVESRTPCFLAAFALQEAIEQQGAASVEQVLADSVARHPDAYWLVVEVDHRPDDPRVMNHGLGRAYYNPYYLLHSITQQRLERRDFWEAMFERAGLAKVAFEVTDPIVDSTGLEMGFLLRGANTVTDEGESRG
jgi:2-ketoarginine methyltransferase